ncbi:MAG TPA: transposase [Chloroflexota bacterium]|nr:transposase [Chloroflexota bacterium]
MRQRRKFEPEFKAKVVLELLRGDKTMAQLCREHALGADLLGQWRKIVVERTPELFAEPSGVDAEARRIAELERLVGQQAMELAVLKKALNWPTARSGSNGR